MATDLKTQRRQKAAGRGRRGEWLCAWVLRLSGWHILARGYRSARGSGAGEIDLIARRGPVLAFIEVKSRDSLEDGLAAVQPPQQRRIVRAAERFVARSPELARYQIRFDVMVARPWALPRHIPDAFRPG